VFSNALSKLPNCQGSDYTKYNNCFAEVTFESGNKYAGEFKDGKLHGQGTLTTVHEYKYVGEWKNGKKHGLGTETSEGGDKFIGEWKNDKKHGKGKFIDAIGIVVNGRFEEDILVEEFVEGY